MKIRNKLILSCAALAAVATTAVSTTFAWYTSNDTVQALNASGASADTGNTSIFISGNNTDWFNKVDANLSTVQKFTVDATDLVPVAYKAGNWVNEKGEANSNPTFVEFTLYLKAQDAEANVDVVVQSITIENTTGQTTSATTDDVIYRQNYLTGGSYYADILNALAFTVSGDTATGFATSHGYSLTPGQGVVGLSTSATAYANGVSDNSNKPADAHAYVNAVAGETVVTETVTQTTALAANTVITSLPANGSSNSLTFRVYLDGADTDCLDACQGQSFKMNISFTVAGQNQNNG